MILEGYPCLTVGTTDKNKSFHPFGLAIVFRETEEDIAFVFNAIKKSKLANPPSSFVYNPNRLIADSAPAIHNGFEIAYGKLEKRVNCWAHVIKNIENFKWFSFDAMIFDINRIRVIKLNREEWENSECTCSHWQKNYKCNHVISLATR